MGEWKDTPLSEVADLLPGYAFKGMDFGVGTSRGVKIKDVQSGVVAVESLDALDVTSYNQERIKKYRLNAGDHLITMTGNLGRVATIPESAHEIYLNQRVAKLLPKPNVIEDFLLYVIKSSDFIDYCITHADSETAQPNISAGTILEYEFALPPEDEQRAIASVLSSLDDKIDLLHRQNKTLEAMAETLFRQWFVEEAEEGWEEGTLGDIMSVQGGTTPSTQNAAFWDGEYCWTTPRDLSGDQSLFLFDTARKLTEEGLKQIGSGLLPVGTLLLSSRAPVGYTAFAAVPVAINQGYIAINAHEGYSNYFIYLWLKANMETVKGHANGSTFQEISKAAFKSIELTIPPTERVEAFDVVIEPLFEKVKTNQLQTQNLTKLRDTLLPKLMSGEVRVEN
jgi:type I restriction enzyme S subunit